MFDQLADTGLCSSVLRLDNTKRESLTSSQATGPEESPNLPWRFGLMGPFLPRRYHLES
jgi:hypothetical protein